MSKRKDFTPEFKREAVRLLDAGQKPATDLARELGVRRHQLYKWKEELVKQGSGSLSRHGACTPAAQLLAVYLQASPPRQSIPRSTAAISE